MSLLSFLPFLIVISGSYLLFKLDFFFIKHPIRTLKFAFSGENKKKSLLSLMLALAGTLGVGNISGVAIGIAIGGAGSVFWLIFSAVFSAAIKYSEVYIAYRFGGVGMISVIKSSFKVYGVPLAYIYAALTVVLSISMGSVFQARAIAQSSSNTDFFNVYILGAALSVFVATVCLIGKKQIKNTVAFIIPIAMIIYTGMCIVVIFNNFEKIPSVVFKIISSAFSYKGVSGGIIGFIVSSGMKEGFARGLLSNEAGAGTSAFSHTSHLEETNSSTTGLHSGNITSEAKRQSIEYQRAGIYGILEVFFDTLLLCPLTAFAILLAYDDKSFSGSVADLSNIFATNITPSASLVLTCSIISFAISTVLCWYYYGKTALGFIMRNKGYRIYSTLFFCSFFLAITMEIPYALFITDTALFLLSVISLSAVIKNRAYLNE